MAAIFPSIRALRRSHIFLRHTRASLQNCNSQEQCISRRTNTYDEGIGREVSETDRSVAAPAHSRLEGAGVHYPPELALGFRRRREGRTLAEWGRESRTRSPALFQNT